MANEAWQAQYQGKRFSPLHEGDTSVAIAAGAGSDLKLKFQSPSRGGHLCGDFAAHGVQRALLVSVPFTRGTPLWPC